MVYVNVNGAGICWYINHICEIKLIKYAINFVVKSFHFYVLSFCLICTANNIARIYALHLANLACVFVFSKFPRCKFGDKCLYIHPPCKFDSSCTRPDCSFSHVSKKRAPRFQAPMPVIVQPIRCKYQDQSVFRP